MIDRTLDQWVQLHRQIVAQEQNSAIATAVTSARQNGTVQAKLETPLPGQPNPMPAIAWNECSEGQQIFLFRPDGESKWYALGAGTAQVAETRVVQNIRRRPEEVKIATGPVKVLFSTVADGIRRFYVGGDRATPVRIWETPENVVAYISNTGRGPNDWTASFSWFKSGLIHYKILQGNGSNTEVSSPQSLTYWGWGFWATGLSIPSFFEAERIEQGSLTSVNGTSSYYRKYVNGVLVEQQQVDVFHIGHVTHIESSSIVYIATGLASGSGTEANNFSGVIQFTTDGDGDRDTLGVTSRSQTGKTISLFIDTKEKLIRTKEGIYLQQLSGRNTDFYDNVADGNDYFASTISSQQIYTYEGKVQLSPTFEKTNTFADNFTVEGQSSSSGQNVSESSTKGSVIYRQILSGGDSAIANRFETDGNSLIGDYPFLIHRTAGEVTETPITNFGSLPDLDKNVTNLIGNKILVTPINAEYRTTSKQEVVDFYTVESNGAIAKTTKNARVFSLRSPECQIHSASAFF